MSFILTSLTIALLLYVITYMNKKFNMNKKKLYTFECGFNPFNPPRNPFSIQFFKVLMIFLLFDMEMIIIMPLSLFKIMNNMNMLFYIMIMSLLIMGLIYEWKEGSLEWLN